MVKKVSIFSHRDDMFEALNFLFYDEISLCSLCTDSHDYPAPLSLFIVAAETFFIGKLHIVLNTNNCTQ